MLALSPVRYAGRDIAAVDVCRDFRTTDSRKGRDCMLRFTDGVRGGQWRIASRSMQIFNMDVGQLVLLLDESAHVRHKPSVSWPTFLAAIVAAFVY